MNAIKKFLKEFFVTKKLYSYISKERYKKRIRENLQKNGDKTMSVIQQVLEDTSALFFFDMGTLLGIVREGRLLSHDLDMDVAVFVNSTDEISKLREKLFSKGCALRFSYSVDSIGIVEDSFTLNDIKFDINYYFTEEASDVCYLMYTDPEKVYADGEMSVVKLTSPRTTETKKIDFHGIKINIPANPEEYLAVRYGENWRVPDKKYVYWKGPSTSATDYVGRVVNGN